MEELEQPSLFDRFETLISAEDTLEIRSFLNDQNISDVAALIDEYPEYAARIIAHMAVHRAVGVFKILDITQQKEIVKKLPSAKTAELLNELPADDRTDFLEELPKAAIRDLIKLLDPEERKVTLSLLGYPEDSVGRLMTPDYVYVYQHNTVQEAFEIIRKHAKNSETIDVIYIINEQGRLVDDIRIRDIILASPDKTMEEITDGRVISLGVQDDQEYAGQIFKMNNRVALPVVDDNNILLGIVTIDDMLWVANEEFSEDMQKMGGTEALNEPYLDIPFFKLIKKRAGWLILLFFGELLTASAMAFFSDELSKALILSIFVPLIISSGGNSGSQASTLIIQAMAVGEVSIEDWWRVMRREILSGLTLGGILGLIGFIRIAVWHQLMQQGVIEDVYGEYWFLIGFTVSFSLVGVVLWGTLTGSMLPLLLKKLGADPAVSSAPFVATLVDVTGLIIYFSMAWLFLHGIMI
ncbi:MAG: magnesium transporter [Chitinophagaceae bacterium]|nr:magnesium transporter [Chitinophagaceae bacterium]MCA6472795.1 magnesium transporter [Chitinophagaceae bacterium]MCA6478142.1 magnesium transporter [Chitinophagaceae bacterium]MCA6487632.1 magnesium transporter [Chitinophagaceae bacterium]MCA6492644.1 magnesium transporter [Chitinophagaceae bacterium]